MEIIAYQFNASPDMVTKAITSALPLIGARSIRWSDANRRVQAVTPFNFSSFGEELDIIIGDDGRVTPIQIRSATPR